MDDDKKPFQMDPWMRKLNLLAWLLAAVGWILKKLGMPYGS